MIFFLHIYNLLTNLFLKNLIDTVYTIGFHWAVLLFPNMGMKYN